MTGPTGYRTLTEGVQRKFNHVLGIDLGGGKGKKTALATLRVDGSAATVVDIAPRTGAAPFYDPTLLDTIRAYGDETLLCIDAPLTLPPVLALRGAGLPRAGGVRRSVRGRDARARQRSGRGAR